MLPLALVLFHRLEAYATFENLPVRGESRKVRFDREKPKLPQVQPAGCLVARGLCGRNFCASSRKNQDFRSFVLLSPRIDDKKDTTNLSCYTYRITESLFVFPNQINEPQALERRAEFSTDHCKLVNRRGVLKAGLAISASGWLASHALAGAEAELSKDASPAEVLVYDLTTGKVARVELPQLESATKS